jgi:hypothetical protein
MEIKTTDEIVLTEKIKFKVDIHGNIIEVKSKINKQWVAVDDLKKELQKTIQFACLESWCASRLDKGSGFCRNCRDLKKMFGEP